MEFDFHLLTLAHKDLVLKYTWNGERKNCDLTFANLYSWHFLYHTEVAEWGGFLIFRFNTDEQLAYMFPLGNGNWGEVIRMMQKDACAQQKPFLLLGVCKEFVDKLCADSDNKFVVSNNRHYADYIYLRESLAQLNGKKLQPKRNHVNKFMRLYPDYEYVSLTPQMASQCLLLVKQWGDDKLAVNELRAVQSEARSIERALTHMEQLDIIGGALFVAGQMVAFTYGAPINSNTFDVCVEKANKDFEGAYAMINKEFVAHLPQQYVYINREEDLGLEGLRKAKLSYQPWVILEKYSLWSACSIKDLPEEQALSRYSSHIKWQTRALWKLCFGDTEAFLHLYFTKKFYSHLNSYVLHHDKLVAALQRLPYKMNIQGNAQYVAYLSGVCTHPDYRGRGLMRKLLKEAHLQVRKDNMMLSVLIPANPELFDFYARFGYITPSPSSRKQVVHEFCDNSNAYTIETFCANNGWDTYAAYLFWEKSSYATPYAIFQSFCDFEVVLQELFLAGGVVCTSRNASNDINGILFAKCFEGKLFVLDIYADSYLITNSLREAALLAFKLPQDAIVLHHHNKVQVRAIDAYKMLCAYAAGNAGYKGVIQVFGDDAILDNNGFYALNAGECQRLSLPNCHTETVRADVVIDISQLAELFFSMEGPYLSLMLNV